MSKTAISVRALSPVGGEVLGFDPAVGIDAETKAALYQQWLKYGILLFHNVDSIDTHLAVSRCFGDLEIHPFPPARYSENDLFIELGGSKTSRPYVFDGRDMKVNRIAWHRDTAYTPDICKGAMLRMVEAPQKEGETQLADTAMAYDELPAKMKAKLEGLEFKATLRLGFKAQTRPGALWKTVREATQEEFAGEGKPRNESMELVEKYPPVVHPALLTHPESGRKCIFLSPTYVDFFLGMSQDESDDLLEYLTEHMTHPRFVYKHRWTVNDAIVWDNRRFMHSSPGNPPGDTRRGLRTTLAGAVRTGRYYDPSAQAKAPLLVD